MKHKSSIDRIAYLRIGRLRKFVAPVAVHRFFLPLHQSPSVTRRRDCCTMMQFGAHLAKNYTWLQRFVGSRARLLLAAGAQLASIQITSPLLTVPIELVWYFRQSQRRPLCAAAIAAAAAAARAFRQTKRNRRNEDPTDVTWSPMPSPPWTDCRCCACEQCSKGHLCAYALLCVHAR